MTGLGFAGRTLDSTTDRYVDVALQCERAVSKGTLPTDRHRCFSGPIRIYKRHTDPERAAPIHDFDLYQIGVASVRVGVCDRPEYMADEQHPQSNRATPRPIPAEAA
jgi:hypothetical protein